MTNASGPPRSSRSLGNSSAKLTNAQPADYFDNGSIAHFSHVIEDLYQFYATPGQDPGRPDGRAVHRTLPVHVPVRISSAPRTGCRRTGNADQFTNGGGPAFINNVFQGTDAALLGAQDSGGHASPRRTRPLSATFTGNPRDRPQCGPAAGLAGLGRHATAHPQRRARLRQHGRARLPHASRARAAPDVPAGSHQFKLQFLIFVPTADLFAQMRTAAAAQDLQQQFLAGQSDDNGLERHITATRRQNFLVPPRRHRAFPLPWTRRVRRSRRTGPGRPAGPARGQAGRAGGGEHPAHHARHGPVDVDAVLLPSAPGRAPPPFPRPGRSAETRFLIFRNFSLLQASFRGIAITRQAQFAMFK